MLKNVLRHLQKSDIMKKIQRLKNLGEHEIIIGSIKRYQVIRNGGTVK
jgi:hypothetical protein